MPAGEQEVERLHSLLAGQPNPRGELECVGFG